MVRLYCSITCIIMIITFFWMRSPRVASYFYAQVSLHRIIVYWWSVWYDLIGLILSRLSLCLSVCPCLSLSLPPPLTFCPSFSPSLPPSLSLFSLSLSPSLHPSLCVSVPLSLLVYPPVTPSYMFIFAFTIHIDGVIPSCTLISYSLEIINHPDPDVNVLADCKGDGALSQQENHTQGFGSKELHVRNEPTKSLPLSLSSLSLTHTQSLSVSLSLSLSFSLSLVSNSHVALFAHTSIHVYYPVYANLSVLYDAKRWWEDTLGKNVGELRHKWIVVV